MTDIKAVEEEIRVEAILLHLEEVQEEEMTGVKEEVPQALEVQAAERVMTEVQAEILSKIKAKIKEAGMIKEIKQIKLLKESQLTLLA